MTQDYEPIELNKNTPEPEEDGAFLINTDGTLYQVVVHDSTFDLTHTWLCDGFWGKWSDISQHRKPGGHTTIQSLAAHDAQIRAEALDFADAEQIDNGEELLNESLSEAVKEYLLYGAHPLSTEDDPDDIWDDAELFNLKLTNGDVIDCSELTDEVLDALKRYLDGRPVLQSIPTSGVEQ